MPLSSSPPSDVSDRGFLHAEPMPPGPPVQHEHEAHIDLPISNRSPQRARSGLQRWSRAVHSYASMAALVIVLFFGVTGVTLNHPEWSLGLEPSTTKVSGDLPAGGIAANGEPQFLVISEHVRQQQGVRGSVTEFGTAPTGGFISYRGPGYSADVTFDTTSRTYNATIEQQGLVGVANDLHKGRNSSGSWAWLIDLSGVALIVIAVSGLTLQLVLRRRRTSTVVAAAVVAFIFAIWAVIAII